jgi:predicted phosphodiesterase
LRIALISDIHSNYHALEAVLRDIDGRGVDQILCLGDITLKGPLPKECVDRVRALGCPVVLGNADGCYHPDAHPSRYEPRNKSQAAIQEDFKRHVGALTDSDREWLWHLPLTFTGTYAGIRLDIFHATPTDNYILTMPWAGLDDLAKLRLSDETAVSAFGHSHRPFIRLARGLHVINTGSIGAPFDGDPRACYALLEIAGGTLATSLIRVPYDVEKAIQAAKDVQMSGWELFAYTARTGLFAG